MEIVNRDNEWRLRWSDGTESDDYGSSEAAVEAAEKEGGPMSVIWERAPGGERN